jgi:hypothetical protein
LFDEFCNRYDFERETDDYEVEFTPEWG